MITFTNPFLCETGKARDLFDLPGALSATLGAGPLVYAIRITVDAGCIAGRDRGHERHRGTFHRVRTHQPITPLRPFASRRRTGPYVVRFLYPGAITGFFFFTTQFPQEVRAAVVAA